MALSFAAFESQRTHPYKDENAVEARPLQNAGGNYTAVEPGALAHERVQVDDDEDDNSDVLRISHHLACLVNMATVMPSVLLVSICSDNAC